MSKAYGSVPTIEGEEIEISATGHVIPATREKRGHSCCGVCCDVRRASIIVDAITLVALSFNIVALFAMTSIDVDDDHVQEALSSLSTPILAAVFIVEVILLGFSIYGAVNFSANLVLVGFVLYCLGVLTSLVPFNVVGVIVNALFAYPHWYLYKEIKSGTMSPSNYYNEEQSCCCV
jgi:hypothetical protein